MKEKKLPNWITNKRFQQILRSKIGVYISYWTFQGMLYADYRENLLKGILDVTITYLLVTISDISLYFSFIVAHSLNMIFNGHIIAMRRHAGLGSNNPAKFIAYIEKFDGRVQIKPYIRAVAAFGSLTRGAYRPTSDIDVRIIPQDDQISFFRACVFALIERIRAVLCGFPLDLYVFNIDSLKKKMRHDEIPMIFCDTDGLININYNETINAAQFIVSFKVKYV